MAASEVDVENFLNGPLVTWLATCVKKPDNLQIYETFFDGSPITEVLLQIDPEPSIPIPTIANLQGLSITSARIKIFHSILKNIKSIYEDELGQVIILLPDCVTLGRTPGSQVALEQLHLLILLLLGCAVQGPTKELFIARIKELPIEIQHEIVDCIKQVTEDQKVVLTQDWKDQSLEHLYCNLRELITKRDGLLNQWINEISEENIKLTGGCQSLNNGGIESNHMAVELADWKARFRKQRQELEEKAEMLTESREELEQLNTVLTKLKAENTELLVEARMSKTYRDELDAMREKAERADKLENEAQRYRERLADAEFYKVRVDELREDNRVLIETREMLESQLSRARQRSDQLLLLEEDILNYKQKINDIALERDAAREKIVELTHENYQLQQVAKSALSVEKTDSEFEVDYSSTPDNSISEQLTNDAETRALKLELENRRLLSAIESIKEGKFQESSDKILDLEKDKKKLTLKCEQLQETCERWTKQNSELESLFKNALQENRKLQDSIDITNKISERLNQELQHEKVKLTEMEKNVEILTKEKQRVQNLCDSIKRRADDSDKALTQVLDQLNTFKIQTEELKNVEFEKQNILNKLNSLEKENTVMQKDVLKLKEVVETRERLLDEKTEKCDKQVKELDVLANEKLVLLSQIEKMQKLDKRNQELNSQVAVHVETITTLQNNLVDEKLEKDKLKTGCEKLGLDYVMMCDVHDLNVIVDKMLENAEFKNIVISSLENLQLIKENSHNDETKEELPHENVTSELEQLQQQNENLRAETARMQVDISTLTSQVSTLNAQQTALQLANSQLVAEKEELSKQQKIQDNQRDTLLCDQVTIRSLHEQLSAEYEDLKKEQENWKKHNRDLRMEIRNLKDTNAILETRIIKLEQEKDTLRNESKSLSNLRAEHSKLKDDFRSLFTAGERFKVEYRTLQEEYKNLKTETGRLKLGNTEMQGELNSRTDLLAGLQLENAKLQQKCEMLFDLNSTLDTDRRKLMDHVSQLLAQYHSLLIHSLEDKEHYHVEEKLFTDKLNNLCRQKEKLEEKIMEHYKKLDNAAASKKKGFGATLMRRVQKASSDIISKVPTSKNRRSWHEDQHNRLTQSQFALSGGAAGSGGGGGNSGSANSGESCGNDSDNSMDDAGTNKEDVPFAKLPRETTSHRSNRSSSGADNAYNRDGGGSALSLGSVGTRRTVYLSEEDQPNIPNQTVAPPPLLVYNKISTTISGETSNSNTNNNSKNAQKNNEQHNNAQSDDNNRTLDQKKDNSKESAVWYEYGCV